MVRLAWEAIHDHRGTLPKNLYLIEQGVNDLRAKSFTRNLARKGGHQSQTQERGCLPRSRPAAPGTQAQVCPAVAMVQFHSDRRLAAPMQTDEEYAWMKCWVAHASVRPAMFPLASVDDACCKAN